MRNIIRPMPKGAVCNFRALCCLRGELQLQEHFIKRPSLGLLQQIPLLKLIVSRGGKKE